MSPRERVIAVMEGKMTAEAAGEAPESAPAKPPEPVKPEPAKPSEKVSRAFLAITRKEREVRQAAEKVRTERAALEAARAAQPKAEPPKAVDPREEYQRMTQALLEGKPLEPSKPETDPHIEALQKELEEQKAWRQSEESKRLQAAREADRATFAGHVEKMAADAGEEFDLLAENGGGTQVYDILDGYVREHRALPDGGDPRDPEAVTRNTRAIMKSLQEVLQEKADAVLATKYAKRKLASAAPQLAAPGQQESQGQKQSAPVVRTLSNSLAGAPPRTAPQRRTPEERRAEAIRVLEKGA